MVDIYISMLQVNQTVDSMVEERALLQKKLQQLQLEVDSHGRYIYFYVTGESDSRLYG